MKLSFLLILLTGTAGLLLADANPIRNSSFELGRAEFGIRRYVRQGNPKHFQEPVFDTTEKIHGKQSIRFDNPGGDVIELVSREYKLIPGRVYTFSWYMKSSEPVDIRAGQYAGEMVTPTFSDWSMFTARNFRTSTQWKRHSITFTAKGKRSWYFTFFRWDRKGKPSSASVWFDALQIREGKDLLPYAPSAPAEGAVCGDRRVRFPGETLPCELRLVNYTDRPRPIHARLEIRDTLMPEIPFPGRTISQTVPPNGTLTLPLDTETRRFGHFRLSGLLEGDGFRQGLGDWFFTEIPRPQNRPINPKKEFATGINSNLGIPFKGIIPNAFRTMNGGGDPEFAEFLKRSGVVFLRLHDSGLQWKLMEPEPGNFDWTLSDDRFQFARRNGFALMPVFGNMLYLRDWGNEKRVFSPLPDWLLKSPATVIHKMKGLWDGVSPDPAAWTRLAEAISSHYKGQIAAYEITNEPNIALPGAKEYIPYLKSAAQIIKRNDPDALIIGGGLTTDYGGKTDQFLTDMGKSGVLKYCDALSFHPYASPLDSSPLSAQSALRNLRDLLKNYAPDLPIWNTELYYIGPAPSAHYAVAGRASHAQHLLRRTLIDLGEGVARTMPIADEQFLQNELAPHWELGDGMVHSGYIPHDLYTGQSVASHLLNGAAPMERFQWPSGATGYLYRMRNGQQLAAVWKAPDAQNFILELPDGEFEVLDMYLNAIPSRKTIPLSEFPVFLRGKNLRNDLKKAQLRGVLSFRILAAFPFLQNRRRTLLLEIQNLSPNKITAVVRPDFSEKPQTAEMEINGKALFFFPGAEQAIPGKTKVYLADGERNFTLTLPPFRRKLLRDGETGHGKGFSFTASGTKEGLHLTVTVRDVERGPRKADAPWNGDSIELFFDSAPLTNPGDAHAGKSVRRLFLAPPSSNGLPELKSTLGMNAENIRSEITMSRNGYQANARIPWSELGMKSSGLLGLDIKINNTTPDGRLSSEIWSGTSNNHRFRNGYGLWHPAQQTGKAQAE